MSSRFELNYIIMNKQCLERQKMDYKCVTIGILFIILNSCNEQTTDVPIDSSIPWVQTDETNTLSSVNELAATPNGTDGTNLFASCSGGMFISSDNGSHWKILPSGYTGYVWSFAVNGTDLFAGSTSNGVFLVTNNGTNWTSVNNGLSDTSIFALAINGTNLFAGANSGVFLSTNNGTNWKKADSGLTGGVLTFAVSDSNIFVGNYRGVFLSSNNGSNWVHVNAGLSDGIVRSLAKINTNLFAGNGDGLFLSTNNGVNWSLHGFAHDNVVLLVVSDNNIFAVINSSSFSGSSASSQVFHSSNSGTSWKDITTGLENEKVSSLIVSGENLFAGTYSGVWRRPIK